MNPATIEAVIDGIINHEGSEFTNDKDDKGGPTKFGITLATLKNWRESDDVTADDVRDLTESEARDIYKNIYILEPRFNLINDDGIATLLIDWAVMSGAEDAIAGLQNILRAHGVELSVDGVLGSRTASAVNSFSQGAKTLRNWICDAKILFHINDVVKRPNQIKYLKGWVIRTLSFRVN